MKLTKTERWILANQYKILEALYPAEATYHQQTQKILEHGYEIHYDEISQYIYEDRDTVSTLQSREVIKILDMFLAIKHSLDKIKDKSGIDTHRLKFMGFDGNDSTEVKYLAYARYFCNQSGDRYTEINKGDDFNSHMPTLELYRQMLDIWEESEDKYNLSKDDIIRLGTKK